MSLLTYPEAAFCVGFSGDLALQVLVRLNLLDSGLAGYFVRHGPFESACIAAGLMYIAAWVYVHQAGDEPREIGRPFVFGCVLDILFRLFRLMPTLDGYYAALTPFVSMVWGGIPMVMAVYYQDWMAARLAT